MATPARSVAASAALAGRSADSLTRRSLFVRVRPPPLTLSERRSVLRVIERYGKTDVFKKLSDNSSFIVIASSTAMAETLILRSPMQYEYMAETFQAARPWGNPPVATVVAPVETTGTAAAAADISTSTSARPSGQIEQKSFTLSIFLSQDYHHRNMIRNSPLHGPWPEDVGGSGGSGGGSNGTKRRSGAAVLVRGKSDDFGSLGSDKHTYIYNALQDLVPESSSSDALCDWRPRGNAISTEMVAAVHDVSSVAHRTATTTTAEVAAATRDDSSDREKFSEPSSLPTRARTPKSPVAAASALVHIRQRQLRRALSSRSPILAMLARESGAHGDNDKNDKDGNNDANNGQGG